MVQSNAHETSSVVTGNLSRAMESGNRAPTVEAAARNVYRQWWNDLATGVSWPEQTETTALRLIAQVNPRLRRFGRRRVSESLVASFFQGGPAVSEAAWRALHCFDDIDAIPLLDGWLNDRPWHAKRILEALDIVEGATIDVPISARTLPRIRLVARCLELVGRVSPTWSEQVESFFSRVVLSEAVAFLTDCLASTAKSGESLTQCRTLLSNVTGTEEDIVHTHRVYSVVRRFKYDLTEETWTVQYPVAAGAKLALRTTLGKFEFSEATVEKVVESIQRCEAREIEKRLVKVETGTIEQVLNRGKPYGA